MFSNLVIVRKILTKRIAIGGKTDHFQSHKTWKQVLIFLHFLWPWQLRNNLLWILIQVIKLTRLLLVNNCNHTMKIASGILWIYIFFCIAAVCLYKWPFVFDPLSLRIFIIVKNSRLVWRDILFKHSSLGAIGTLLKSFSKIYVALLKKWQELTVFDLKYMSFKLASPWTFLWDTAKL